MQKYINSAFSSRPVMPLKGATVTVTTSNGDLATLYSDNAGTLMGNPTYTDEAGNYWFYAADGRYTITISKTGFQTQVLSDVLLEDPTDQVADLAALQLANYAALRQYTGSRQSVYVTGYLSTSAASGVAGTFVRDNGDTTTADNGGTVIVDAANRRWKRQFAGPANVLWFGADPSYVIDSTAAFQAAILFGSWNGITIYVPNGTYRIEGTIYIGTFSGQNCYSVTLTGESTHGSVMLRPKNTGTGPIMTVSGFHNVIEKLTYISEVNASGTDYSASHGLYIRGNPQPGTNGNGTKYCKFRNLKIYRVGVGIQLGDYDTDGKDPDIETNSFEAIEISNCNTGWYFNGQNILHNPAYACHTVDCRDYLVHQKRGGDTWFIRSYFGGMYDFLTNNYNVPTTSKIFIEAGVIGLDACRSECWASTTGNATSRYALNVTSTDSKTISVKDTTFTTRDNLTTEPSIKLSGQGSGGSAACKATLIGNTFYGYVEINTIDVFGFGNACLGTATGGNGVVNGRLLSTNQKTQAFRDVFMDSNQTQELNGVKFKRNSSTPLTIERAAVANTSEWQGYFWADEAGMNWGRNGHVVNNATTGRETSLQIVANRMAGSFVQFRIGAGTASPSVGVWNVGDRIVNSTPAVGSPKGWTNTAAGGASSTTRGDATAYTTGTWIKWPTGTTVWECTTAGTTTTGAPSITGITVGQTVTDGTVVWTLRATTQANFVSEGNL